MREKLLSKEGITLTLVIKKVKGRLYVYEQFRQDGRVVTHYVGPLEELVRVYQIVKSGNYVNLTRRQLTTLARKIVEEYARKCGVVNSTHKRSSNKREVAPGAGFEPAWARSPPALQAGPLGRSGTPAPSKLFVVWF